MARIMSGQASARTDRRRSGAGRCAARWKSCSRRPTPKATSRSRSTRRPGLGTVYGDSARLQQVVVESAVERGEVHAGRRRRSACGCTSRAAGPPKWSSPTPATAFRRSSCRSVFEPFRQADASHRPGGTAASASGCRSSSISSRRTAARSACESAGEGQRRDVHRAAADRRRRPQRRARAGVLAPGRRASRAHRCAGMSVLVVDDDEESRHVVAAHLASRDAAVLTAGVGCAGARDCCSASTSTCCSRTSPCPARTATR